MVTQSSSIPAGLPEIERELSEPRLSARFHDPVLEQAYRREHRLAARLHNRITVCIMAALFDAFLIGEMHAIPEVVHLSVLLRLAVFTPAVLAYVLLDWRGLITGWITTAVTVLLIAPTMVAVVETAYIVSPTAVPNHSAVPLLLLAVIGCRISLGQAAIVNVVSCLLYVASTLKSGFIPPAVEASMILTDLTIGVGTFVFAWRLELRDRKVFLFTRQAALGRDMLAAQNRMLARLSQVDALTGLGNRRCFDEAMAALWAAAAAKPATITLVLFDIDCFKQFNDALGHQAGDECLGAVARAVTRCVRDERDILVRYGGEEFAIILANTALEEGCTVAERVRLAVLDRALPHPGGGPHHLVTVSLGVATVSAPSQSSSALVEAADQCLYGAKRHGRNRVEHALREPARLDTDGFDGDYRKEGQRALPSCRPLDPAQESLIETSPR